MKELNPMYAGLGLYAPMPDTPLWTEGVNAGLVIPDEEVTLSHFFNTNPKDYFLKDPAQRVRSIPGPRFRHAGDLMGYRFNRHNTRLTNLARRAFARRKAYFHEPLQFARDVVRGLKWAFGR